MAKASRTYNVTVPANSSETLNVTGEFYYVLECDLASFLLALDGGSADYAKLRTNRRLQPGDIYKMLRIENPNAAPLTIKLVAGFGAYNDDEVLIGGSVTVSGEVDVSTGAGLSTAADVSMLAAAKTLVIAANAGRKSVTITNLDGSAKILRVGDANVAAARGVELPAGVSVTIETEAAVYAWNPGAAAQSVGVMEVLA